MSSSPPARNPEHPDCSSIEAAKLLGLAVRSVQLMVDRGELEAWKTPGGHRRIARASIDAWLQRRRLETVERRVPPQIINPGGARVKVLLIEDSAHFQNLVGLLVRQTLPDAELLIAEDGIAGLAMAGKLEPEVLIIDILLPGIDGATLITSLRSQPQFRRTSLIVVTALDGADRQPYEFALQGLPVIHKTRIVAELPAQLRHWARQGPVAAAG
jgi:excisionase family DNA binding protein